MNGFGGNNIIFRYMLDWVPHGRTGYNMAVTGEHISSSC